MTLYGLAVELSSDQVAVMQINVLASYLRYVVTVTNTHRRTLTLILLENATAVLVEIKTEQLPENDFLFPDKQILQVASVQGQLI